MKYLLTVLITVLTSACAPASKNDASISQTPAPATTPTKPVCAVYDACTYSGGGFGGQRPVFNCVEKTLQAADHPEIAASYFQSQTCLTYREDFHDQQSFCGPMNQFPCTIQVQGPGPLAIPTLNL